MAFHLSRPRAFPRQRQQEFEGHTWGEVLDPDPPAVGFDDSLTYREPQSGHRNLILGGEAEELIEDPLHVHFGDRRALVVDLDPQPRGMRACPDTDGGPRRRVIDGIAHSVA